MHEGAQLEDLVHFDVAPAIVIAFGGPAVVALDLTRVGDAGALVGIAHLEDARILAQKQKLNPDAWSSVKKTLPLLALPEYYEDAKFGYARGGMPVAFVDRVRAYYDILLVHQLRKAVKNYVG